MMVDSVRRALDRIEGALRLLVDEIDVLRNLHATTVKEGGDTKAENARMRAALQLQNEELKRYRQALEEGQAAAVVESPQTGEFIRAEHLSEHPIVKGVLSRSTVMKLLKDGSIPSRCVGRARIVRISDVEKLLSMGTGEAVTRH